VLLEGWFASGFEGLDVWEFMQVSEDERLVARRVRQW